MEGIEVRWGLPEDEPRIAELLELNGMPRWVAYEERFIVAERRGEVLAGLRYRTEIKRLLLGLLFVDPWAGEGPPARALYAGAWSLAREIEAREIIAVPLPYANYPHEVGYRRRGRGWRLDAVAGCLELRGELPASGWRRVVALLGMCAVPFFRVSRDW